MKQILPLKKVVITALLFLMVYGVWAAAVPTISSFTPTSGTVGTTVTITGTNFNTTAANNVVFFGATKATVTAATATSLTVTVPTGATYAPVSVSDITSGLKAYSVKPFNITSKGGGLFGASVDYTAGAGPFCVVIGDIDGDGKADVVVTNYTANTVSVLRNTSSSGTISFAAKVDYTTGTNPFSAVIGDVDGDGKLDLVVSNYGSSSISVFRNTSSVGSLSFATKVDYTITSSLRGLAIGDLDADGKPDIAVTTNNNSRVFIIKNQSTIGNVSFDSGIDFGTGLNPSDVAIDDIDGDGKPDLIVANQTGSSVSVLRNSSSVVGTIAFDSKVDFAGGSNPFLLGVGDMDGDGKPDLVVANSGSLTASVFRNISVIGTVAFDSYVNFTTGGGNQGVAVGDLDGDEKLDFTTASANLKGVSTFQNTGVVGTVNFATKVDYIQNTISGVAPQSRSVAIGDLDGDGKADLAVANYGTGTVSVMRNIAPPPTISSFTPTSAGSGAVVTITGTNLSYATAVSFGGTAATSFTVVSSTSITATVGAGVSGSVSVTTSGGTATLAGFTWVPVPTITSFTPTSGPLATVVTITGTNFTGATAVSFGGTAASSFTVVSATQITAVVAAGTSGSVSVTTAGGTATKTGFTFVPIPTITTFTPTSASTGTTVTITGTNFTGATAVNFGGTAASSFTIVSATQITAVVAAGTSGSVSVITAGGTATKIGFTFVPIPTITTFTPASGAVGTTVIITGTNFNTTAANNVVFFGATMATVNTATSTSLSVQVPMGTTYRYISVSDITTGLTAYSAKPFIVTYTGGAIGASTYATKTDFTTGTNPNLVAIGDIDGDGKPDLAVANYGSATVSVYRNTSSSGTLSFATKVDFTTGTSPNSVAIGDVDGDGKPDLAVANTSSNTISVFRNTGSSGIVSFALKVDFTTGTAPRFVSIIDIDSDGKPDLLATNYNSASVSVFRNTSSIGTVSFSAKVDFTTGTSPYSVAIGDIDGDGKPDLAVANTTSNTISVFRNTGSIGTVSFASKVDFTTGSAPYTVAMGDIDGDGKLDLAVATANATAVSVFRNTSSIGTVSFATKVDFTTGSFPWSVAIGDIDGDGKSDLAVTNANDNTVSVFRNTGSSGTISFATKMDFATGNGPRSVAIGDIDGDNMPDLAVANISSNTVSVLHYNPAPTIASFTPTSGGNSTTVTITGTNFTGATAVSFGGTAATSFTVVSSTSITAVIAAGTSGSVSVTTAGGTATKAGFTFVPIPTITSFTPTSAGTGTTVTITGTYFTGATAVSFGSTAASAFTVVSATQITAVVAAGASGNVSVTTVGGTATLAGFTYLLTQNINFGTLSPVTYGDSPFIVSATGGASGNSVVFTSSDPTIATCTGTNGSTITIFKAGICTIYANQAGNATYNAAAQVGQILTVNAKPITITANAGQTKVYGTSDVAFAYSVSPALIGSDAFTGALARATGENVGSYAINIGSLTNANYSITFVVDNYSITAKPITVTTNSGQAKVYGASDPIYTYSVSPALVGTDAFTGTLARAVGENIGSYAINLGTLANSNYNITFITDNYNITAKPITVTADASQTKVYGANDPIFTYSVSPALVGSDVFTGVLTRDVGENIGSYAINQGTLDVGANYTISYVSKNFDITAKPITVTADVSQTKVYGDNDPVFTYSVSPALVGTDYFTGLLGRTSGETAGKYVINQGTLTAGNNYSITFEADSFLINKKIVVISVDTMYRVVGSVNPNFKLTFNGHNNSNLDSLIKSKPIITCLANVSSSASDYAIVLSGGNDPNFAFILKNGILRVTTIAGDKNGDGKITSPEIAGDANGDGIIDGSEMVGDKNGDGKITLPEITGDTNGDGIINGSEMAGDKNGDGKITLPEITGDTNGDGTIDGFEIAGDKNGDGKITLPEIAGDSYGDGIINGSEIAGDKNGDGKITLPEITGDSNGDGIINGSEIAGDKNGDGKITLPEISGDTNGDGTIDGSEIAGDKNGDGKITLPEITGDTNGDGTIDGSEIAGDKNGDGKISSSEIAGDINGDGKVTAPEIAGDINGNGKISFPEVCGDLNGDETIDSKESADVPSMPILDKTKSTLCIGSKISCSNYNTNMVYNWQIDGNVIDLANDSSYILPENGAGEYSLSVVNQITNCHVVSDTITIKEYPAITPVVYEKKKSGIVSILVVDNTSNALQTYQWTYADGSPLPSGIIDNNQFLALSPEYMSAEYKVAITDSNGCKAYSAAKSVTLKSDIVTVYPTVSSEHFTVSFVNNEKGNATIRIINALGVVFQTLQVTKTGTTETYQLYVDDVPEGIYYVELQMNNFKDIKQIVIQK